MKVMQVPFIRRVICSMCFHLDASYHWSCDRRHYRYRRRLHREGNTTSSLVLACLNLLLF
jgi:hypothetical protein